MADKQIKVGFLSTYPPRACGIATFTQDLVEELNKAGDIEAVVVAISDKQYQYGAEVLFDFPQQSREQYGQAAARLNESALELLVIEHEFGIFGGKWGCYVLDLLERVKLPVITTLHTVIASPTPRQRDILQALCQKSAAVIVMANNSLDILEKVYQVERSKIKIIHHGVPWLLLPSRKALKKEMGLEEQIVVSTFGLMSPGKGLEYGIEAVARVAAAYPNILYFILGQTHPNVKKHYGEAYRTKLEELVQGLGIERNVRFVNKYLSKEDIVRYLRLSDIYMTPYLSKEQAVSGTLAYAVGYGRVIISTPYSYAREMLADGRGLLAGFRDAQALAEQIFKLIEFPELRKKMEAKTLRLGQQMLWEQVAERYAQVFAAALGRTLEFQEEKLL